MQELCGAKWLAAVPLEHVLRFTVLPPYLYRVQGHFIVIHAYIRQSRIVQSLPLRCSDILGSADIL